MKRTYVNVNTLRLTSVHSSFSCIERRRELPIGR